LESHILECRRRTVPKLQRIKSVSHLNGRRSTAGEGPLGVCLAAIREKLVVGVVGKEF
jgi:hypothetical protein